MAIGLFVIVLVISFALGSIPWGIVIGRVFYHKDPRDFGSGNIGTTNSIRALGKVGGYAVFVGDFGKGLVSGLIAMGIAGIAATGSDSASVFAQYQTLVSCAFFGCIFGHIYSPWLHFKGGKGIAVAVGCMFVSLGPVVAICELLLFTVVVVVTKYVSAGSIASAVACPIIAIFIYWGNPFAWVLTAIPAIAVVYAHRGNIERLHAGTESKVGQKKKN